MAILNVKNKNIVKLKKAWADVPAVVSGSMDITESSEFDNEIHIENHLSPEETKRSLQIADDDGGNSLVTIMSISSDDAILLARHLIQLAKKLRRQERKLTS